MSPIYIAAFPRIPECQLQLNILPCWQASITEQKERPTTQGIASQRIPALGLVVHQVPTVKTQQRSTVRKQCIVGRSAPKDSSLRCELSALQELMVLILSTCGHDGALYR
jgi:hypothetical protein